MPRHSKEKPFTRHTDIKLGSLRPCDWDVFSYNFCTIYPPSYAYFVVVVREFG